MNEAALKLIARHGYEAVSMRQLAAEIGLQQAALYRYIPSKQDMLFALLHEHMVALLASCQEQVEASPPRRLYSFINHHVRFHLARRDATHVSNMELRSLDADKRVVILDLRTRYEEKLRAILRDGVSSGAFDLGGLDGEVELTARAIIQMLTGVVVWFRETDRLPVEAVSRIYSNMALRIVGAKTAIREETACIATA
ncbi:TetR family transcriptional regulator [Limoniibacter endophyticus]|uniref:TetR family transcriptional regulator n=1 Tax=Limoniibacter endophyticus TaxID=1565040 RepID=A0A8J3DN01_9HYPH|nr:TetR family transcriptional regulator [Limoniibacter endophyticus]